MRKPVWILLLLAVSACGPVYQTQYELRPPATVEGRMCANNCILAQQNCRMQCDGRQRHCEDQARINAQSDYISYLHQQQREGRAPTKTERDFYRRYPCETDCPERCEADQRMCHSNCGGQVIPHTVCTAFCE